jgi:hypothetical protein
LMVPAMDLQHPSKASIGLGVWQLGLVSPSIPHFQHSPDATGVVPGEREYGHVSLTYSLGLSMFHWVIWALYSA